ncbi:hypothetical protein HQ544_01440 [Candidatus Falkowbacteria bacterium]|nr:hypothetical protein [Candidatus Falkowbacteria bacterium]
MLKTGIGERAIKSEKDKREKTPEKGSDILGLPKKLLNQFGKLGKGAIDRGRKMVGKHPEGENVIAETQDKTEKAKGKLGAKLRRVAEYGRGKVGQAFERPGKKEKAPEVPKQREYKVGDVVNFEDNNCKDVAGWKITSVNKDRDHPGSYIYNLESPPSSEKKFIGFATQHKLDRDNPPIVEEAELVTLRGEGRIKAGLRKGKEGLGKAWEKTGERVVDKIEESPQYEKLKEVLEKMQTRGWTEAAGRRRKRDQKKEGQAQKEKSPDQEKEDYIWDNNSGARDLIGNSAYAMLTRVLGVKFGTDVILYMGGEGDLYKYQEQKKHVKEKKQKAGETLEDVLDFYGSDLAGELKEQDEGDPGVALGESRGEGFREVYRRARKLKEVINSPAVPKEDRKALRRQLFQMLKEHRDNGTDLETGKASDVQETLDTFLKTKISKMAVRRDFVNTALTVTGFAALRLAVYPTTGIAERFGDTANQHKKDRVRLEQELKSLKTRYERPLSPDLEVEERAKRMKERGVVFQEMQGVKKQLEQGEVSYQLQNSVVGSATETGRDLGGFGVEAVKMGFQKVKGRKLEKGVVKELFAKKGVKSAQAAMKLATAFGIIMGGSSEAGEALSKIRSGDVGEIFSDIDFLEKLKDAPKLHENVYENARNIATRSGNLIENAKRWINGESAEAPEVLGETEASGEAATSEPAEAVETPGAIETPSGVEAPSGLIEMTPAEARQTLENSLNELENLSEEDKESIIAVIKNIDGNEELTQADLAEAGLVDELGVVDGEKVEALAIAKTLGLDDDNLSEIVKGGISEAEADNLNNAWWARDNIPGEHEELVKGIATGEIEIDRASIASIAKLDPRFLESESGQAAISEAIEDNEFSPEDMQGLDAGAEKLQITEPVYNNQLKDATIGKGEGIEHALIRQLREKPEEFGFEGDASNPAEVKAWAGHKAHEIAKGHQYAGAEEGEVWVRKADKVAYILNKEGIVSEYDLIKQEVIETGGEGADIESHEMRKPEAAPAPEVPEIVENPPMISAEEYNDYDVKVERFDKLVNERFSRFDYYVEDMTIKEFIASDSVRDIIDDTDHSPHFDNSDEKEYQEAQEIVREIYNPGQDDENATVAELVKKHSEQNLAKFLGVDQEVLSDIPKKEKEGIIKHLERIAEYRKDKDAGLASEESLREVVKAVGNVDNDYPDLIPNDEQTIDNVLGREPEPPAPKPVLDTKPPAPKVEPAPEPVPEPEKTAPTTEPPAPPETVVEPETPASEVVTPDSDPAVAPPPENLPTGEEAPSPEVQTSPENLGEITPNPETQAILDSIDAQEEYSVEISSGEDAGTTVEITRNYADQERVLEIKPEDLDNFSEGEIKAILDVDNSNPQLKEDAMRLAAHSSEDTTEAITHWNMLATDYTLVGGIVNVTKEGEITIFGQEADITEFSVDELKNMYSISRSENLSHEQRGDLVKIFTQKGIELSGYNKEAGEITFTDGEREIRVDTDFVKAGGFKDAKPNLPALANAEAAKDLIVIETDKGIELAPSLKWAENVKDFTLADQRRFQELFQEVKNTAPSVFEDAGLDLNAIKDFAKDSFTPSEEHAKVIDYLTKEIVTNPKLATAVNKVNSHLKGLIAGTLGAVRVSRRS